MMEAVASTLRCVVPNIVCLSFGLTDRLFRDAREDGIEVWDCVYKENVLVVPWFLAFQGDNPMASEFASHIGMGGKFFCRVCHARGADEKNRPPGAAGEIDRLKEFMTVSQISSEVFSWI